MYRGKMKQILKAYGHLKESVTAIMMLYKNMKAIVCSCEANNNFFDIVAGALEGDTLALYMFMICQDFTFQMPIDLIKENGFMLNRPEADDISHKLWEMQTMQII